MSSAFRLDRKHGRLLSYVPGDGCPEPFYLSLGFRHTGRVDEGEVVLELPQDGSGP